jgi:LAO/AO transport system kinase
MKAGLMEIADVFVVNKADRPDADMFVKNLRLMLAPAFKNHYEEVAVIKTVASQKAGIAELAACLQLYIKKHHINERKSWLLAEKAWQLIQQKKMKGIDKKELKQKIEGDKNFNLYRFVKNYY